MSKKIMAINSGSSSLKFKLFEMPSETVMLEGQFERIGEQTSQFSYKYQGEKTIKKHPVYNHREAVEWLMCEMVDVGILDSLEDIEGIGHRISHGGTYYKGATLIDETVMERIGELGTLSPLHNPVNLIGIKAFRDVLPMIPSVAIFDTSFSHTITPDKHVYAIPYHFYEEYGIKRYGFHGISHQYIAEQLPQYVAEEKLGRVISCHLGSGGSLSALSHGKTINNSMGFTPLAGIVMGTRSGDVDPQILPYIAEKTGKDVFEIKEMLNKESGLLGISKLSNDCRDVEEAAFAGNQQAQLALDVYIQSICKYIGSYLVDLGGLDTLVFTAGIGEHSSYIRTEVCKRLAFLGLKIDQDKNQKNETYIHHPTSQVDVIVIPTDEEIIIAREVFRKI